MNYIPDKNIKEEKSSYTKDEWIRRIWYDSLIPYY